MHEWAIAQAIAEEISSLSHKARVSRVTVLLGELQSIDADALKSYMEIMIQSLPGKPPRIAYRLQEAVLGCRRCGYRWKLSETKLDSEEREIIHFLPEAIHSLTRCPRCGSRDLDVLSGRGVSLRVEYEEEEKG